MIVLDENTADKDIINEIANWYKGKVVSLKSLRVGTIVKDDSVLSLLRTVKDPTFVTNNVSDFWRKVTAQDRYCIVCMILPNERLDKELSPKLRTILRMKEFKTKSARMGKVIRVRHRDLDYYQVNDRTVHSIHLPSS